MAGRQRQVEHVSFRTGLMGQLGVAVSGRITVSWNTGSLEQPTTRGQHGAGRASEAFDFTPGRNNATWSTGTSGAPPSGINLTVETGLGSAQLVDLPESESQSADSESQSLSQSQSQTVFTFIEDSQATRDFEVAEAITETVAETARLEATAPPPTTQALRHPFPPLRAPQDDLPPWGPIRRGDAHEFWLNCRSGHGPRK